MSKKNQGKLPGAATGATEHGASAIAMAEGGRIDATKISRKQYSAQLHDLQVELVKPDRDSVFEFTPDCVAAHRLAR